MNRTCLVILGLLLLAGPAAVQSQFEYTVNADNTISITGYSGAGGVVSIPDSIAGHLVSSIGNYAFSYCSNLSSVTIPSTITNIGEYVFSSCANLTAITVDATNAFYSSLSGVMFDKSQSTLIEYPGGFGGGYVVPSSVTSIAEGAFQDCVSLTNITFSDSLITIGDSAFFGCIHLTGVSIPATITTIGDYAFYECGSLGSIAIPDSVTNIGNWAFADCASTVTNFVDATIYACTGLTNVIMGTGIIKAGYNLFAFCDRLTSLTIPNGVTTIGAGEFGSCAGLTSITLPDSVTSIEDDAFFDCTGLTKVRIPNSVVNIGNWVFEYCSSLTNVTIPSGVTNIGLGVFEYCSGLTAITVAGQNSFYSSTNGVLFNYSQTTLLQYPAGLNGSYTIPSSVTTIGDSAFAGCTGLSTLMISSGVTNIEEYALYNCTNLNTVTIPGSVTSVGYYAFSVGTGLTSVFFQGNAPTFDGDAFASDNKSTIYYLPNATGWGSAVDYRPVVVWNPLIQASGTSFGVQSNQFGFNITGTTNIPIVVEACTDLANPFWISVQSLTLTNGLFYFSEPLQRNDSGRYYRISSP